MGLEAGVKMITSPKKDKAIDNNATYREILTVAHTKMAAEIFTPITCIL